MKLLFDALGVQLFAGDARDFLGTLLVEEVDVTITDPPYSRHVHEKNRRGAKISVEAGSGEARTLIDSDRDLGFEHLGSHLRTHVARELARVTKRWSLVFSDNEHAHEWTRDLERYGLEHVRTMHWHKRGGAPQFTGDRPAVACEAIVLAHPPGAKRWNGGGTQGFWSIPPERKGRIHTTQKPLELMTKLVELFTDPGETILDPFAGGATTLVAAMRSQRKAIGIELDPEIAARAADRLAAERLAIARATAIFDPDAPGEQP